MRLLNYLAEGIVCGAILLDEEMAVAEELSWLVLRLDEGEAGRGGGEEDRLAGGDKGGVVARGG